MNPTLAVSRLVKVAIILTPQAAQAQNLNTMLLLGTSAVIDTTERYRDYDSLAEVGADFGSTAPEYLAAQLYFSQSPQPRSLKIGRWFKTAASGKMVGALLTPAQQALSNFTAVTTGGFTYTLNGGVPTNVTGVNLSAATSLNNVASLITAALTGATMVWNATYQRFELTSSTTGATSTVSFLSAPGSGTDLSALLKMRSTDSGAYQAPGAAAESALTAVQYFEQNLGQTWYALNVLGIDAPFSDHLAIAGYIEGLDTKHLYGVSTQDAGVLSSVTTSDIAYQLAAQGYNRTLVQYSSNTPYSAASLLGRAITVNYAGNSTVITLMFKDEPGIVGEFLNATQANALRAKNCNVFVNYNNNTTIIQNGTVASGRFIDEITGTDWLAVTLQNELYNILYTSPTKIPQTDAGMHVLTTKCEQVCGQGVTNGLLAPGVWNSAGFGILNQGDYMDKGYYVYAAPIATQSVADRAARKSVPIQIAAKLAGAIHEVSVDVTVNQ